MCQTGFCSAWGEGGKIDNKKNRPCSKTCRVKTETSNSRRRDDNLKQSSKTSSGQTRRTITTRTAFHDLAAPQQVKEAASSSNPSKKGERGEKMTLAFFPPKVTISFCGTHQSPPPVCHIRNKMWETVGLLKLVVENPPTPALFTLFLHFKCLSERSKCVKRGNFFFRMEKILHLKKMLFLANKVKQFFSTRACQNKKRTFLISGPTCPPLEDQSLAVTKIIFISFSFFPLPLPWMYNFSTRRKQPRFKS